MSRRHFVSAIAALLTVAISICDHADACPGCVGMGTSLAQNVSEAGLVVFGKLSNARKFADPAPGEPDGTTDLAISRVIKSHQSVNGKNAVVLPRFIAAGDSPEGADYIIFAEVVKGQIDPYRGLPVEDSNVVEYLAKAVEMVKAPAAEKFGFFFEHLDDPDSNVSGDAYKVFANAPYADVAAARDRYDSEKIAGWLRNSKTPSYAAGLYGVLLGLCGDADDANLLRSIIDNPKARPLTGVDGLMNGYCAIDPKAGPDYVLDLLADPDRNFNLRYSALRAIRFVLTEVPQADKTRIHTRMAEAVQTPDIADLVIDELRRNEVWKPLPTILALYGEPKFDLQVVRRAIIRFALRCPGPSAKAFVEKLRAEDPRLVRDVEEILEFEEADTVKTDAAS